MNLKHVGEEIYRERRRRGITQAAVAADLGVSQAHISNIERGRSTDPATVQRLCVLLEIDFEAVVSVALGAMTQTHRAIRDDAELGANDRDLLLHTYEFMRARGPLAS